MALRGRSLETHVPKVLWHKKEPEAGGGLNANPKGKRLGGKISNKERGKREGRSKKERKITVKARSQQEKGGPLTPATWGAAIAGNSFHQGCFR